MTEEINHLADELYASRNYLFIALMRSNTRISWRANNNHDGTMFSEKFIAGIQLPTGQISYHLPVEMWELLDNCGIATMNKAPEQDVHTSKDIIDRLRGWFMKGGVK